MLSQATSLFLPLPSRIACCMLPALVFWPALMWTLLSCWCRGAMAAFQQLLQLLLVGCCAVAKTVHSQRHHLPPCQVVCMGTTRELAEYWTETCVCVWPGGLFSGTVGGQNASCISCRKTVYLETLDLMWVYSPPLQSELQCLDGETLFDSSQRKSGNAFMSLCRGCCSAAQSNSFISGFTCNSLNCVRRRRP